MIIGIDLGHECYPDNGALGVMKATRSGLAAVKNFKAKGIYELVY